MHQDPVVIFWFRRDLRLKDNAGLYQALISGLHVIPLFIFDTDILDQLEDRADRRVEFIHQSVSQLHASIEEIGSSLLVRHGKPLDVFRDLTKEHNIVAVYTNHDYEPYAINRDAQVGALLESIGGKLVSYKDQVIFERSEVVKDNGEAYTVFTPYSRKWKALVTEKALLPYASAKHTTALAELPPTAIPSLESMNFKRSGCIIPPPPLNYKIEEYGRDRDFPGLDATSKLGVHLRFGTISIRLLVNRAMQASPVFLNELIWREFYQAILYHHPHIAAGQAFKPAYDRILWRTDEGEFQRWCEGMTGFPIVDAGMRQLNETGFMHNRVRMITASFLCKHLLLDWRLGEAYFASKLLDFEFASNNGGWQWAAGSGCDAAPYFRIFNPWLQTKKFDPDHTYIWKWVPEFESDNYPPPMVDHESARKRCLAVYSEALKQDHSTKRSLGEGFPP